MGKEARDGEGSARDGEGMRGVWTTGPGSRAPSAGERASERGSGRLPHIPVRERGLRPEAHREVRGSEARRGRRACASPQPPARSAPGRSVL